MTALLVTLTVIEIALVVGVLAVYLILIGHKLRVVSTYLGKVAFGVRAVESHTAVIGPSVLRINERLREIDAALGPLAEKAEATQRRG
ncbi:MAG: hypothetical protein GEU86_10785 [Actinophytocola sp.]|nr:hypothetical protein [Actinophytocola sp.]